jgi:hypothetical protein
MRQAQCDGLSVRAYVGVTDADWVRHLASSRAAEVNFWRPAGDRAFRALSVGEPFFFKTHHPENRVVGGGFFSGFASLTISEAWQIYGEANGASTLDEMRARVGRYRRSLSRPCPCWLPDDVPDTTRHGWITVDPPGDERGQQPRNYTQRRAGAGPKDGQDQDTKMPGISHSFLTD